MLQLVALTSKDIVCPPKAFMKLHLTKGTSQRVTEVDVLLQAVACICRHSHIGAQEEVPHGGGS